MATDTADRWSGHMRGLVVTTLAALAGVGAALVSSAVTGTPSDPAAAATDLMGVYVLVGAIIVQFPVLRVAGIDVEDFSAKDYLYVAFMTFSFWFVSWTVLLTTNSL